MITFKQSLLTLGREKEEILKRLSPHLPKNLENPLEGENKVQRVVERNKTAVKRYLKRMSATSFGSIRFSASRQSFDKNTEYFLSESS